METGKTKTTAGGSGASQRGLNIASEGVQKALLWAMMACTFNWKGRECSGEPVDVDNPPELAEDRPLHPWVATKRQSQNAWLKCAAIVASRELVSLD